MEWEREFLIQRQADVDMTFDSFAQLYEKNKKPKLKLNISLVQDRCDRCAGCRLFSAFGRADEKKAPEQTALQAPLAPGKRGGLRIGKRSVDRKVSHVCKTQF